MKDLRSYIYWPLILFVAFIFIQSLFFKFTDSPETQYIFEGKLDPWGASLGFPGLFTKGGVFSAKVIGILELIASLLLLASLVIPYKSILRIAGAALGFGIISTAIFFHLYTPLGISVQNTDGSSDGGTLFILACGVWLSCAALLFSSRADIKSLLNQKK